MAAADVLAYASQCGLTAADFEKMSIGFVIDTCLARIDLIKGKKNSDEETYLKMKGIVDSVRAKFESGGISQARYDDFLTKYRRLEAIYGFDYD